MRRASKYKFVEVMDSAAHLEHLQSIFKEFTPSVVHNKETSLDICGIDLSFQSKPSWIGVATS